MKRLFIISILLVNLAFMFGQKMTLKELVDKDGVITVSLSKNMLSLFPKNSDISYGEVNVTELLDKLSYINIFASPKGKIANNLVKDAAQFVETSGYEKLMSIKTEKNEDADFYIQVNKEYISELVLIVRGKSKESAVMQLIGKFTMEDIQQIIAKAGK